VGIIFGAATIGSKKEVVEYLDQMSKSIPSNLADVNSFWASSNIGLGCFHQFNTPESLFEKLPYQDPDGFVISSSARIDNREELWSLVKPRKKLPEITDSELILETYKKSGANCLQKLLGDFVFAIWDPVNQYLFAATDILGTKPFYFSKTPTSIFFSGLPSCLFQVGISREINKIKLAAEYLYLPLINSSETIYLNVTALPPAHYLIYDKENLIIQKYWELKSDKIINFSNPEEYYETLREILLESIKCRLRSHYKIGTHLSGGLDSSILTILANRLLNKGKPIQAFSWSPIQNIKAENHAESENEVKRIKNIAAEEQVDVFFFDSKTMKAEKDYMHLIGFWIERTIQREAAKSGVRTILSGWGGDDFISYHGRNLHIEYFYSLQWLELLKYFYHDRSKWKQIGSQILVATIRQMFFGLNSNTRNFIFNVWSKAKKKIENQLKELELEKNEVEYLLSLINWRPLHHIKTIRQSQKYYFDDFHLQDRIEEWSLQGVFYNIEYRYPLLDKRILEFCMQIPGFLYKSGTLERALFINTVRPYWPVENQINFKKEVILSNYRIHAFITNCETAEHPKNLVAFYQENFELL